MAEEVIQAATDNIAALVEQLQTGFLKDKRYKDLGKPMAEIVMDFKAFVGDELLKERPDLVESGDISAIQATAERAYSAACRGRIAGQASLVKFTPIGASFPFDYVGNWIKKRKELFLDAKRKQDAGNSVPMNILLGRAPNNEGKTVQLVDANGVAVEHRDNKGDAKGRPFKVTRSYLCNIPAIVQETTGKKRTLLVTLGVGGEGGDDVVNVKCSKCGFISYHKVCPNEIEVKVPNPQNPSQQMIMKKVCGTVKPFYELEDIVSRGFMTMKTNLKITTNDEGAESVSWVPSTSVLGDKVPMSRDEIKTLLKTVLKSKCVVGKDLPKFWSDNKDAKGAWCIYIGTVSGVDRKGDKQGKHKVDLDDSSMSFVAGGKAVVGVPAFIPQYVWDCMDGNQITAYSQLMVIGQVNRREKSQLVNGQWQNLPGQWRDPEINAWGFFVLDGGQERKIKQDVAEGSFTVEPDSFSRSDFSSTMDTSGAMDDHSPTTVVEQVISSSNDEQPSQPSKPSQESDSDHDEADPSAQSSSKPEDDWV